MLEFVTLDVFTNTSFKGNPLAIVLNGEGLSGAQMQTIARELNLSETIFVMPPENPANTAKVRIFFPNAEIPFAGHPTIGCAVQLSGLAEANEDGTVHIVLEEVAGDVPVVVRKQGNRLSAEFTAPILPMRDRMLEDATLVANGLGLSQEDIGNDIVGLSEVWQAGPTYLLVPLASLEALERARPTGAAWDRLMERAETFSAWLFVPDGKQSFRARMFSPAGGTPEDPATGSAAVTFAGLMAHHGHFAEGENRIKILQGVEMGRPSMIQATISLDGGKAASVRIGGGAVRISTGRMVSP